MRSYEETVWLVPTGRSAQLGLCLFKHQELLSIGHLWYLEILDFLNSGLKVHGGFDPRKINFD
jgi:hypothetical protein